ncbi:MAG TPA: FKBP-type peptidyl-prolyl cis-trans isomerase [Gemmatimonadaceae bacterium]|nr:FKBP-type peptidyl-prolyl cis-trans isomerase [Gemmatimonadaceae bacterium]
MRYLACLVLSLALAACTSPDRCAATDPSNPATETFDPSLNINLATWTKTASGVYEQDVVVPTDGETLTSPTNVSVYYVAYLPNGSVVDQQLQQPFTFDLRTNAAFGIVDGMMGMKVGGRRRLVVPSDLALGACGKGPIPPNSTLVYEIELLAINP